MFILFLFRRQYLALALAFALTLFSLSGCSLEVDGRTDGKVQSKAKNIIFMVTDGMGLANVTAARIFKNGQHGESLYLETLPQLGYQRTHSADNSVTDSAAAASAWANGEKYRNGEISCHDDNQDGKCEPAPGPTILETARDKGKSTGLVVTSTVTHATPAAFGAHVSTRNCENEIARQYIKVTGVDVILGGGLKKFDTSENSADECSTYGNFISVAEARGYDVVYNKEEMDNAVARGTEKILGLFAPRGKTPELFRVYLEEYYRANEPTLSQMTAAALEILEKDRDGFFLLVEGSQIDWANHRNSLPYQISETLGFDEAVRVVLDWMNAKPKRRQDTLVIITPDHETGGFAINGGAEGTYSSGDLVNDTWTTGGHTATDVPVWSHGPGSEYLGRAHDNTDLYKAMKEVLD